MSESCPRRVDPEELSRYVAGTLPADDVSGLEAHLFECGACLGQVKEMAAMAAALRELQPAHMHAKPPAGNKRRLRIRLAAFAATALATAATIALFFLPGPRTLHDLSGMAPPRFEPLAIRLGGDAATRLADLGMAAYQGADYATAATHFAAAARQAPAPSTFFYLGVSQLLAGDPQGAVRSLRAALLPPGNPYIADAHFYLAKAMLRLNRPDSALVELDVVSSKGTALAVHARALADSVRFRIAR